MKLIWLSVLLLVASCTTSDVIRMNSLGSDAISDGSFVGLEKTAALNPNSGNLEINIIYSHGIGWTQKPPDEQNTTASIHGIASDFIQGLHDFYGDEISGSPIVFDKCASSFSYDFEPGTYIRADDDRRYLVSDISNNRIKLDLISCIDKVTVQLKSGLTYNVYRVFWDEVFWLNVQYAHVGYDDDVAVESGKPHWDAVTKRAHFNRMLKDQIVTHGLSDAAMYMGDAGELIREGLRGGICAAFVDSHESFLVPVVYDEIGGGYEGATTTLVPKPNQARKQESYTAEQACDLASQFKDSTYQPAFAFVTESLGSRAMFDVLSARYNEGREIPFSIGASEHFMLANQLPLIGLGQLKFQSEPFSDQYLSREENLPKIVAISEVHDLLTYELVPYFEGLWGRSNTYLRCGPAESSNNAVSVHRVSHCQESHRNLYDQTQPLPTGKREQLQRLIGFEVVDVRVEYTPPLLGVIPFHSPTSAHLDQVENNEIFGLLICGATNGESNADSEGCL